MYKRKAKIWYSDEPNSNLLEANIDTEAALAGPMPETWNFVDETFYNFIWLTSPEWTANENISVRKTLASDFADCLFNTTSEGFMKFIWTILAIGDKKFQVQYPDKLHKARSFMLEMQDLNVWNHGNTPINIDGERYEGTKIQATVMPNSKNVSLIA